MKKKNKKNSTNKWKKKTHHQKLNRRRIKCRILV